MTRLLHPTPLRSPITLHGIAGSLEADESVLVGVHTGLVANVQTNLFSGAPQRDYRPQS